MFWDSYVGLGWDTYVGCKQKGRRAFSVEISPETPTSYVGNGAKWTDFSL